MIDRMLETCLRSQSNGINSRTNYMLKMHDKASISSAILSEQ